MERLIDNDLMYGGMLTLNQPHMIARYNAALAALGLKQTKRNLISLDATGYSPEVAEDLDDKNYLDPHGVNRRFIIVSPAQGKLPVTNINFSYTSDLVHAFFEENKQALQVLTLKDVVYGEIDNSTYQVGDLADILSIKRVEFIVKTADKLLDKAKLLNNLVERFQNDRDSWRNDALIDEMLELAKACGDPRSNELIPRKTRFEQRSFWTRHFGGIYIFHDDDNAGAVVVGAPDKPEFALGQSGLKRYLPLSAYEDIYTYLYVTDRVELWNAAWLDRTDILDLRIKQYIYAAIARANPRKSLVDLDETWVKQWVRDNFENLSEDGAFPFLTRMRKNAFNGSEINLDEVRPDLRFLTMRANPDHPDHWVVNRLLSEYVPFDFLTRFIVNKEAFYEDYQSFKSKFRDYVVHAVTTTYFPQREQFLARMFEK